MNYIITKHPRFFDKIGDYNFCNLEDMILPDKIAIDTETSGLFARIEEIFCTQIGTGENNYLIHMYDGNYHFTDLVPYIQDKTLVLQNALFDLGFFYKYKFYPEKIQDTMLASKVLYNGDLTNMFHDFGTIMKRELGVVYDKTTQKNIHIVKLSVPTAIEYSFNDVDRLLELHDVLEQKLEIREQMPTYNLQCRFIRALAYMERCGLPISSERWLEKMKVDDINAEKYGKEVEEYIYDNLTQFANGQLDFFREKKEITIKISSPLQMLKVFKAFKINTTDKNGKDSIKENVISKTKHPFVDVWLKYQEAQHRVTTFGQKVYDKILDGKIFTNYNPMVETSRLSSRKGSINFLNFPSDPDTRKCFKAHTGHKMIVCDFSAQEGVIMADLSGDKAMTASVVDGADLHCLFARVLFPEIAELSDEEIIEKHKDKRQAAKVPRFLFSYGGNAYTLHQQEGIPMARAEEIDRGFKELHAELYEWGDKVYDQAIEDGYISSVDGWRLYLVEYDNFLKWKKIIDNMDSDDWKKYRTGKAERQREKLIAEQNKNRDKNTPKIHFYPIFEKEYLYYKEKRQIVSKFFKLKSLYLRLCLNSPVQTRGAHQLKLALSYIFEWILEKNLIDVVEMSNAVHDEAVLHSPDEYSEIVRQKVEHFMKKAGNHYLTKLTINAEASVGESWYEAK